MNKNIIAGAAALLSLGMAVGDAKATLITGTWDVSGSGGTGTAPSAPTSFNATATFSFDSSANATGSIASFTSDFGVTSASFNYFAATHTLGLGFNDGSGTLFANFINADTVPAFGLVSYAQGSGFTTYSTSGGSFTPATPPTPVPEPGSMALLASGLIALGAMRRRRPD